MKVIAHKANSREEIEGALKAGVDLIEIDVWATRGRKFLIFHDIFLDKFGHRSGWTMYLTPAEIEELRRQHEGLLYLEEALELIRGRVEVLLELKRTRHDEEGYAWIEEELLRSLEGAEALDWITVVSFDHLSLRRLRELYPAVRVGLICAGEWLSLWGEVEAVGPVALLTHWAQTTPRLVAEAHRRGIVVYPWVVNRPDLWETFREIGVDGIITDEYEKLLEFLGRRVEVRRGSLLSG